MTNTDDDPTSTVSRSIQCERVILAGTLAAFFLVVWIVGGVGLITKALGAYRTWILPVVAVGVLVVAITFTMFAFYGRGPVAMLARRLPSQLDGSARRRPVTAWLVGLATLVALLQITRLSCFMVDPTLRWGSAYPPEEKYGVRHMCLSAYIYAADLNRRGVSNVYAEQYYPTHQEGNVQEMHPISTGVANLAPHIRDAYEYPPPFLLLPRAALMISNDFLTIRTGWFMLQSTLFLAIALILAWRIGGHRGLLAGLLLPVLLLSFPFMFNFQWGQFHLTSIMLAVGGMLAISEGRERVGGALLGAAIVTKAFPVLLLFYLAVRRRAGAVFWTLAFSVIYVIISVVVLGSEAFRAFFTYHLPRVASGEAFSFFLNSDLQLAANTSVLAIPYKLGRLGVPGMSVTVANTLIWLFTALLFGAAVVAARRRREPYLEPAIWLALLALGAMRSPDAPNVYVGTAALWLLTLLAFETRGRFAPVTLLVLVWIFIFVQPPLPDPKATIVLWMSGQIATLIVGFWVLLRKQTPIEARELPAQGIM
jgi:alpha-1,2-mannosyltransferase